MAPLQKLRPRTSPPTDRATGPSALAPLSAPAPVARKEADRFSPSVPATVREKATRETADALSTIDAMLLWDEPSQSVGERVVDWVLERFGRKSVEPLHREWAGADMKPATVWPLSQLFAAELDRAALTGDGSRLRGVLDELSKYERGGAYAPHPGGDSEEKFYDDNAWIGLDLVQAYEQTGDRHFLAKAEALVPFLEAGMLPSGGILWKEGGERTLNTCANAPTLQLFLALHAQTGNGRYLDDAKKLEGVLNDRLRRSDGLYADNLTVKDGAVHHDLWSYNQGAAIGANLQLAEVAASKEEKARYLGLAVKTGSAVLEKISAEPDWLWKQPPAFNAVFFRNLMKLDLVSPDPRIRATLDAYLERARTEARNPANGAYELGGVGRYSAEASGLNLIDQAAFAQMFALQGMSAAELAKVR